MQTRKLPKILVVDDDSAVANSTIMRLRRRGFMAEMNSNPSEVLQQLELKIYDIYLIDVRMSTIDGISLSKEIKNKYPKSKIFLYTGHATDSIKSFIENSGVVEGCFLKPLSLDFFCSVLNGKDSKEFLMDKIEEAFSFISKQRSK